MIFVGKKNDWEGELKRLRLVMVRIKLAIKFRLIYVQNKKCSIFVCDLPHQSPEGVAE